MQLIVDLHIHSHYSRACSQNMNIQSLYSWGKIKGINIIGTGDFTHPLWFKELQDKLEPAEPGLFRLKDEYAQIEDKQLPASCRDNLIRFALTVEISNIYSKYNRVRKLHNVLVVPSFPAASYIINQLNKIGNLKSDGRPILGMDSYDLLKITLESDPNSLFFPAHIWTPWFAMFGSKSGFDSIEEAFGDLASEIKAIETGLSSDPFMNWRLSQLDGLTILSNSDAHSAAKLGREATILDCELSYFEMINAIKTNDQRIIGTIEFFPEEGKYHYDGHRSCSLRFTPKETKAHKGLCPKCGRPLVVGVEYRVDELADRPFDYKPSEHKRVEHIIPLVEILCELTNTKSPNSKKVQALYQEIYSTFGNEFDLLRTVDINEIKAEGFPDLAHALEKMRAEDVFVEPGYDGVFGTIRVFKTKEDKQNYEKKQMGQLGLNL